MNYYVKVTKTSTEYSWRYKLGKVPHVLTARTDSCQFLSVVTLDGQVVMQKKSYSINESVFGFDQEGMKV